MCTKVPRQQTWGRGQQKGRPVSWGRKRKKKVVGGKELEGWMKLKGMDKGLNCLKEAGVLGASSGEKESWNGMSYADRGRGHWLRAVRREIKTDGCGTRRKRREKQGE